MNLVLPEGWEIFEGILVPLIGTRVRVRAWESLCEEFSTTELGDICSRPLFTTPMREFCGKTFNVQYRSKGTGLYRGRTYLSLSLDLPGHWTFSTLLVEEVPTTLTGVDLFISNLRADKLLSVQEVVH